MSAERIGYWEVLRRNRSFRYIWLGEVVSLTGDWFTSIALFAMLLEYTGKGEAVGLALIARMLPVILFGPMAGVFADRYSRKAILVTCDLLRCVIVLGFLLIRDARDVWLAYALSFAQLSVSTFFETAEQAAVGSVVSREEIVPANTLQGITWSSMLALGALLGGIVTSWVGRRAAFCIDSASYLLSALFVSRALIPHVASTAKAGGRLALLGIAEAREGLRYIFQTPGVRGAILAKAGWGLAGGGAILLYSVFGGRVFAAGRDASTGIGLLYASRGIGALLGPVVARLVGDDREPTLRRAIGVAFFVTALAYGLLAGAPSLAMASLCLVLAHMGASTNWVFSTALINLRVHDHMRGRVFAADMALCTAAMIASIVVTGAGLDRLGLSPRMLMAGLAAVMLLPALAWIAMGRLGPESSVR